MSPDSPAHDRHWSLEMFRMTSASRQQRTLHAFARVAMPGVQALGVVRDQEILLVVDCTTIGEEIRARRIVMTVDPGAERVLSSGPRRRAVQAPRPEVAVAEPVPLLAVPD